MKLYHVGFEKVSMPRCSSCRDFLDLGKGFYLVPTLDQARSWAEKLQNYRKAKPVIGAYVFDRDLAMERFRYLYLPRYDAAWLGHILESRSGKMPRESYDIIEGGCVDDRIVDQLHLFEYGYAGKDETLRRLSGFQSKLSICIHSQDAADICLKFKGYISL